MNIQVIIAYLIISIVWGTSFMSTKLALQSFPPFWQVAIQFLSAGGLMLIWCKWKKLPFPNQWQDYLRIGMLATLFLTIGNGFLVWSQIVLPSGLAAIICAALPLWMAVFSIVKYGFRKTGWVTLAGVITGFTGMVILVYPTITDIKPGTLSALIIIFLSTISWASGTYWMNQVGRKYNTTVFSAIEMSMAGVMLLLIALCGPSVKWEAVSMTSILSLGYLSLVVSILGYTAFFYLFSHASPTWASTYAYINPVIAVFLGWLILREPLTLNLILGAMIILASVAVVNGNQYQRSKAALKKENQ